MRSKQVIIPILSAAAADGVGTPINVRDFRHIVLRVSCAASTTLTIKIQGSTLESPPTFGSAQTEANHWDFLSAYDLNDPSSIIVGDTGIAFSAVSVADSCRNILVNVDLMEWINVQVSSRSAGNVTVSLVAANDTIG